MGNLLERYDHDARWNIPPENNLNRPPSLQMRDNLVHFGLSLSLFSACALGVYLTKVIGKEKDEDDMDELLLMHKKLKLKNTQRDSAYEYSSPNPADVIRILEVKENKRHEEKSNELNLYETYLRTILDIRCSVFRSKTKREDLQDQLIQEAFSSKSQVVTYAELQEIYRNDYMFCADTADNNGKLRQVYMKLWRAQIERDKYKNIVDQMKQTFSSGK